MIIGLTGGIASGKSTVSSMLKQKGFTVIDADIAARAVVEPGEPALLEIVRVFGEAVLTDEKKLDRAKMAAIVFHDEAKRQLLNSIVHPAVRSWMLERKKQAIQSGKNTIVFDIPLLFESKLEWMADRTLLVYVEPRQQLIRLKNRNHLSDKEACARIQSQMPIDQKKQLADDVIDNSGTMKETNEQLESWIARLRLIP